MRKMIRTIGRVQLAFFVVLFATARYPGPVAGAPNREAPPERSAYSSREARVARVAGETAPLLFTAFGNPFWSAGWLRPTSALPMMVYTYGLAPYEDWHRQAWAAGLVLLVMMLIANIGARLILSPRGAQST